VIGYVAGTGYDQATGLGSVDANNLATAFAALIGATGTATTLTVAPGIPVAINEQVTFIATVAPNTLTTAPVGTVTFTIDGTQTPVLFSSTAPYIATFTYRFPFSGTYLVSATYSSGNTAYTGSTSPGTTVTVAGQGTAATTTTVVINPTSFLGSSVILTATVVWTGGIPTEPLTFSTGGTTIGSIEQLTFGAGLITTATVTVNATGRLGFRVGTDTITATYGGDTLNAASFGTTTEAVALTGQTLSFAPVGNRVYGGAPFAVSTSSASTGAVTYTVVSGPATVSGAVVTVTGVGTVMLSASQAATGDYAAATATTSFTVYSGSANTELRTDSQSDSRCRPVRCDSNLVFKWSLDLRGGQWSGDNLRQHSHTHRGGNRGAKCQPGSQR
jgi:hypothetical protein